jgi:hypothetical protein
VVRSGDKEVDARWGFGSDGDPAGIQPLISALDKRMSTQRTICK